MMNRNAVEKSYLPVVRRNCTRVALVCLALCLVFGVESGQAEELVGVVYAAHEAELSAEVDARIDTVLVALGDVVERGAVLVVQDSELLHFDLAEARAMHAAYQADLTGATVRFDEADSRHSRHQASSDSWSAEELATARLEMEQAKAEQARAAAVVDQSLVAVRRLETRIDLTKIRAPFSGSIARVFRNQGMFTRRGASVVRIISNGDLQVRFAIGENQTGEFRPDQRIQVRIGSVGTTLAGTVLRCAPEIDAKTNMMVAEATLIVPTELQGVVLSGMTVSISAVPGPE